MGDKLDGWIERLDRWFYARQHLLHFLEPIALGFVGCLIFAGFDWWAGTKLLKEFSTEHLKAIGHPFVALGLFLMSVVSLLVQPDGSNAPARWVAGTFARLTEHVLLLALGVFLWIGTAAVVDEASPLTLFQYTSGVVTLLFFAALFRWSCKYLAGDFKAIFVGPDGSPKRLALVLIRLGAIALLVGAAVDVRHYAREHASHGSAKEKVGDHATPSSEGASVTDRHIGANP